MNNCPYCGQEMEDGTLWTRGISFFLPHDTKPPAILTKGSLDGAGFISFPPYPGFLGGSDRPTAFICRSCKTLIMPFPET